MKLYTGRNGQAVEFAFALLLVLTFTAVHAQDVKTLEVDVGESSPEKTFTYLPLSTESPRQTLNSFIRLTWLLESALQTYGAKQTRANFNRIRMLGPRFLKLIDRLRRTDTTPLLTNVN